MAKFTCEDCSTELLVAPENFPGLALIALNLNVIRVFNEHLTATNHKRYSLDSKTLGMTYSIINRAVTVSLTQK